MADMNSQFIQGIQFDWNNLDEDSYVRDIQAFQGLETLEFSKSVTFFVGENGSGKSTLLEAIAVAHGFNPEGGTKNYVFSTYDEYPELCDAIRLSKGYRKEKWGYFLRAESFYNVATQEEQYADIAHPSLVKTALIRCFEAYGSYYRLNITNSHTGRVFLLWYMTISVRMACIFWTSPKRPCLLSDS